MRFVRSVLFVAIFYAGTAVAVAIVVFAALAGRDPLIAVARGWASYHRWCAKHFLGITTRVEGRLPVGPALVAAKHQSMYETLELMRLLGRPSIVLKRELADIPAWGWAARRYGVIPVDRAGGANTLRIMLRAARGARDEGRTILIFPEGTRVAPGTCPDLQPGFAGLYRAVQLPVVPVALDSGRLWPRRSFVKHPGVVTMRFGEPIPPGLSRAEIQQRVHAAINVLETEAPTPEQERSPARE